MKLKIAIAEFPIFYVIMSSSIAIQMLLQFGDEDRPTN
ncbi:putative membrane protein [Lyngbya aestuarii BL J]|uniref:Putative membrane protein n=1 Tax=Lyngbya aestuarii BL J TaxID=1348334 RepID=U7QNA5_9CYAN|nr:putative membrane protein [Lyngbya aestuarii BL J]